MSMSVAELLLLQRKEGKAKKNVIEILDSAKALLLQIQGNK
jgi:hypothetical protein